jgi:hypothetical protein
MAAVEVEAAEVVAVEEEAEAAEAVEVAVVEEEAEAADIPTYHLFAQFSECHNVFIVNKV